MGSKVQLFGLTQKVNHRMFRKDSTGYPFPQQFSVALLALRLLRGSVLLSQLKPAAEALESLAQAIQCHP